MDCMYRSIDIIICESRVGKRASNATTLRVPRAHRPNPALYPVFANISRCAAYWGLAANRFGKESARREQNFHAYFLEKEWACAGQPGGHPARRHKTAH